jgi:hypothetical protein
VQSSLHHPTESVAENETQPTPAPQVRKTAATQSSTPSEEE